MLLSWSGGCDSTVMLYEALKTKKDNETVRAISVSHIQVTNSEISKIARAKIKAKLARAGLTFQHVEVAVTHEGSFQIEPCGGLSQPALWLQVATSYLEQAEDLALGYITGDDIWHYRNYLCEAFQNTQVISNRSGQLQFPLEWYTKSAIIERLKEVGLYNLCWWCEFPSKGRPCTRCAVCIRHKTALYRLELDDKLTKKTKK